MQSLKEEILKLIREDSEFRTEIEKLLFETRLSKIIEALEKLESNQKSQLEMISRLAEAYKSLTQQMEVLTKRVDSLTQQMEVLTKRVDSLTQQMEVLTKRVDSLTQQMEVLTKRVDSLTQQMEVLTKRVDSLTQQMEVLTKRVDSLTQQMESLASQVQKLVESQAETNKRISQIESTVSRIDKTLGTWSSRWGLTYENLIREFFRELIKLEGIDLSEVSKFTYKDETGIYGFKGKRYEVDIIAKNKSFYIIEVKSFADIDDLEWFDLKCKVISDVLKAQNTTKLLLAITTTKEVLERAKELEIKVIYGELIERQSSK